MTSDNRTVEAYEDNAGGISVVCREDCEAVFFLHFMPDCTGEAAETFVCLMDDFDACKDPTWSRNPVEWADEICSGYPLASWDGAQFDANFDYNGIAGNEFLTCIDAALLSTVDGYTDWLELMEG